MSEVTEGLVIIDEGSDPELTVDGFVCCWTMFVFID